MSTGNAFSGDVLPILNQFADLHNHQDSRPPDSGDLYGFIDKASGSSLYQTRYVVTQNGTVYALVITDLQAAKNFNINYPRQPSVTVNGQTLEPDFPESIANEYNEMVQIGGASYEMALAFILEKYDSGVALLKQDTNGNFKALNTKENIDANGIKTYTANNCQ